MNGNDFTQGLHAVVGIVPMANSSRLNRSTGQAASVALSLTVLLAGAPVLAGEVRATGGALGLGTAVNGLVGGGCAAGLCQVGGGTRSGGNLFHRFSAFDTRGGITGVNFANGGSQNVFVGVTNPMGSFIDKLISFSSPGNLFWLSPGGIAISGAGGFANMQQLNLSTATSWRLGNGIFDAAGTTAGQAALLSGTPFRGAAGPFTDPASLAAIGLQANGDLSLSGGLLTVDESLLLDAQGGNVILQAARLQASGGEIHVTGRDVSISGSELNVTNQQGMGGRIAVKGGTVSVRDSRLDASGATGGGEVEIAAVGVLSLQNTEVVSGAGDGGGTQDGDGDAGTQTDSEVAGTAVPDATTEAPTDPAPEATADPVEADPMAAQPGAIAVKDAVPIDPTPPAPADGLSGGKQSGAASLADGGRIKQNPPIVSLLVASGSDNRQEATSSVGLGSRAGTVMQGASTRGAWNFLPKRGTKDLNSAVTDSLVLEALALEVSTPPVAEPVDAAGVSSAPVVAVAPAASGRGGQVAITGATVTVESSTVDVSAPSGGGTVRLGGGLRGADPTITNAQRTSVDAASAVRADATAQGQGGTVVVYGTDSARVEGVLSARGGPQGGDGGLVETSSRGELVVNQVPDASAPKGKGGTWLIDPNNVTIQAAGPDSNVTTPPVVTTIGDSAVLTSGTVESALNAGTSVSVATSAGGTQAGNITVASPISKSAGGDATLTLTAHNNINLNASISSSTGQLNLSINPNSDASGGGATTLASGATLALNGGTAAFNGSTTLGGDDQRQHDHRASAHGDECDVERSNAGFESIEPDAAERDDRSGWSDACRRKDGVGRRLPWWNRNVNGGEWSNAGADWRSQHCRNVRIERAEQSGDGGMDGRPCGFQCIR